MLAPLRWVRRWALWPHADWHHLRATDYWCGVRYGDRSVIINRLSRKLRGGKKVFFGHRLYIIILKRLAGGTKVTMRFWLLGQVAAIVGLMVFIAGDLAKSWERRRHPPRGLRQ